ncbi:MAG: 1-deoxy-D-xylulose-5-phosphate synthase [Verrucomicrobiaceae bacterium]|nr:1-deoxy-D-xylulose-5-phosphate synthase [Verrucomicrobiaceae bacterium]
MTKTSVSSSVDQLPAIQSPAGLKALPLEKLPALAEKIRRTLIETLSETGGHLGPNLGVVELSIAMHRVFNTPQDKFVWDVAHQAYVHKMITGRWDKIHTIRQYEGLNGFALRTESEHDCYGAGHAGTALSAALGFAVGRDLQKKDDHVVCVAGDAAFTCGPSFEALNNISSQTKRLIVVLNDNEWSIDRNVGAIAKYFNSIATHDGYADLHQKAAAFVESILGKGARRLAGKVEESAKNLLLPASEAKPASSVLFEEFGIRYYGPIDGHDIPLLIKTFEFLKKQNEPVLLHIITEKGRGYKPALEDPGKFHGLGKYNIETGETPSASKPTYSQVFARSITDFAKADEKIVAITAAMPGGTGLSVFKKEIPQRYYDVGIAEEHAALFACGLACQGLKPFLTIYSTFMQRAYDMIIHDMAIQNLPVRLCMDRGGLSGDDGPTHHGLFDIGYLRPVPNLVHMQPKDEDEFVDMLWTMANYEKGPIAIRYPRGNGPGNLPKEQPALLEIGKAEVISSVGEDVVFIAIGDVLELAKTAASTLAAEGVSSTVVNARWIKPLDEALFTNLAAKARVVCTLEDHVLRNGFGCGVMELLSTHGITTPVVRIGWPDEFIEHGSVPVLREKHGLTAENAVRLVKGKLGR